MSKPVMGDQTPRTAKAIDDAWKNLPTSDHRLGYMISFAQSLELELRALRPEGGAILRDALVTVVNVGSGHAKQVALDALRTYDSREPQRGES